MNKTTPKVDVRIESINPEIATSYYVIWSHEHGRWWRTAGGGGYTKNLAEAGRYSREAALRICIAAIPGTAQRLGALPELPVRLADLEAMLAKIR